MRTLFLAAAMVLCAMPAFTQTAQDEFERGNSLYREGKFEEAAAAYEAILRQGFTSASVYFNLGNSYYRMGKVASAILSFERAYRLQPNDPDIKHNLDLVNLRTADRIEPLPDIFFVQWLRSLSAIIPLQATAWIFAILWALLFLGLAGMYVLNQVSALRLGRFVALVCFILLIPFSALMIAQISDAQSHNDAIITTSVVTAKTSPDAQAVDAFVVHEGLKVKLSDALSDWVKIVLADGKVGWVRTSDCERI